MSLLSQQHDLYQMMKDRNEFYFSIEFNELQDVKCLADLVSVDRIEDSCVIAYANDNQYSEIIRRGYEPLLLMPPSMIYDYEMFDGMTRGEFEWDEYPTYDAYVSMMEEYASDFPTKCSLMELGVLASGRKILVMRLNDGMEEGKPKVLLASTIHGDETTGYVMMLRLIDELLNNTDSPDVKIIMENVDLFICPNANPDGTYRNGNSTVKGATRANAFGVDMNRNYPDFIEGLHPDNNKYALETEMFMQLAEDYGFTMAAHYHGGAEVVNYPWDNNYSRHVDDEWWKMISRQYADLAQEKKSDYMTDHDNGITNGSDWYVIYGGRQDYMNYYHQCRELTIECSSIKCPPASYLLSYWEYNYNSIFSFLNQSLCGIHGTVKDAATEEPLEATIRIVSHDDDHSFVESQLPFGNFHRPIKSGTYVVEIIANGYCSKQETVTVYDNEKTVLDVSLDRIDDSIANDLFAEIKIISNKNGCLLVDMKNFVKNFEWKLLDVNGKIVRESKSFCNDSSIKITGLKSGIYFFDVYSSNEKMLRKIVVE